MRRTSSSRKGTPYLVFGKERGKRRCHRIQSISRSAKQHNSYLTGKYSNECNDLLLSLHESQYLSQHFGSDEREGERASMNSRVCTQTLARARLSNTQSSSKEDRSTFDRANKDEDDDDVQLCQKDTEFKFATSIRRLNTRQEVACSRTMSLSCPSPLNRNRMRPCSVSFITSDDVTCEEHRRPTISYLHTSYLEEYTKV